MRLPCLAQLRPRVALVEFAGAAGTLASLGDRGLEVQKAMAEELGIEGASTLRKHVASLRRLYPTPIELDLDGEAPLPAPLEREIFRIAQEAMANALKHAHATRLRVRLRREGDRLELVVADDGAGFDPQGPRAARRLGLVSMRELAEALGGELRIGSRRGEGTSVVLEVDVGGHDPRPAR